VPVAKRPPLVVGAHEAPVVKHSPARTSALAIASLVCAILWAFWVGSVAAIVLGHVARRRIRRSRGMLGGARIARAGLFLGYLEIALLVIALLAPSRSATNGPSPFLW
jgi:threonine/homoserine/homoserine lactone efflux protein